MSWIFLKSVTRIKILTFVLGWPDFPWFDGKESFLNWWKTLEIFEEFSTYFFGHEISRKKTKFCKGLRGQETVAKKFHPQEKSLIYSTNDPKLCNKKYHSISNLFFICRHKSSFSNFSFIFQKNKFLSNFSNSAKIGAKLHKFFFFFTKLYFFSNSWSKLFL